MLDKAGFIDHIGDFMDNNMLSALNFFIRSFGSDDQFAFTGCISSPDAGFSHDNTACREVRAFDAFHKIVKSAVRVFNQEIQTVNDFSEVMCRNIGCHTDSNADRTVNKNVRETGRQNNRFFESVIVVGTEIDRIFIDVSDHFHREF